VSICAALAWVDESEAWLTRCIASLEGLCDEIVAVDGSWDLHYPDMPESPVEQEAVIWQEAHNARLIPQIFIPREIWSSQVAKRDFLMRRAGERSDWVFIIDADEYIVDSNPEKIREELSATDRHSAKIRATRDGRGLRTTERIIKRFYRAGTRCPGPAHNAYTYNGEWLHGDGRHVKCLPALNLSNDLHLHHNYRQRSRARNRLDEDYRLKRARAKAEAWK
jgi:hypothetical protein